jgi:hypothetical protein
VHCDNLSGASSRISQRIKNRNARTHERSRFFRGQVIGNCGEYRGRHYHVRGITTVKVDPGDFAIYTHSEVTTPTLLAHEAMPTVPTDADSLINCPRCDVGTHGIDAPGDLMTGDTRILKSGPDAVLDHCVAMANAACLDLHAYVAGTRFGNVAFDEFPFATCFAYLRCLHFRAHYCS